MRTSNETHGESRMAARQSRSRGAVGAVDGEDLRRQNPTAALTKSIKMGAAVKLLHLQHPTDVAIQAAVTDHMLNGRFIFGYGSGFRSTLFTDERGLGFEDRHERLNESLDFILKAWTSDEPFDWNGKHWKAKNVVALPKPYNRSQFESTIRQALKVRT